MKTIKNLSDNQLRELFQNMPMDSPSENFNGSLFARIEKEAARKKFKQQLFPVIQLALGIVCICGLSGIAIYYCGFDMSASIRRIGAAINLDFHLIAYGLISLLLLICDTLIRQHKHKHS